MGIVGVAIVKYQGTQAEIDTFLLSCRAIGRGAERALLVHILNSAKAKDCTRVLGHFIATKKNGQVSDFYPQQGFRRVMENDRGSDWELTLDRGDFESPNWIKVIADQPEGHNAIG
jgi:predicted enzyme involved in methoxymalonyl-ACP biosynthesis